MSFRLTQSCRHPRLLACLALLAVGPASLADRSDLDASGCITAVYQSELATEAHDSSVSGDLRLEWAAGGGSWVLYLEGASGTDADSIFDTYPEISADAGTVLDRNGNGHAQISELHYRIDLGERSDLTFGQIDPAALIDRSRIANDENTQFLGTGFVNNLTINFPASSNRAAPEVSRAATPITPNSGSGYRWARTRCTARCRCSMSATPVSTARTSARRRMRSWPG